MVSPTLPVMSTPEGSPSSKAAAMDQYLPWNGLTFGGESADRPLPPASLTPQPTSATEKECRTQLTRLIKHPSPNLNNRSSPTQGNHPKKP